MRNLYEKELYHTTVPYINGIIREYDITKANISILLWKGLIKQSDYDRFFSMDKQERQIRIGIMQRDYPRIKQGLKEGFVEARKAFFESNNIQPEDVISIRKDSITLLNKPARVIQFGPVFFRTANIYTSYTMLPDGIRLYFREDIDVIGMSDEKVNLHRPYFYDLLETILEFIETAGPRETLRFLQEISERYVKQDFDLNYYREFNNRSLFRTYYTIAGSTYYLDNIPINQLYNRKFINGIFNYSILQHFYKIFSRMI